MEDIIEKMQTEEKEEEEDERRNQLIEKLQKMALDEGEDLSYESLGPQLQVEFLKHCRSGNVSKYVIPWKPWWSVAVSEDLPPLPKNIKKFAKISAAKPSPTIPFIINNVLLGYTATMLVYNGDYEFDEAGALGMFLQLTTTLSENQVASSLHESLNIFLTAYSARSRILGLDSITPEIIVQATLQLLSKKKPGVLRGLQEIKLIVRGVRKDGLKTIGDNEIRLSNISKRIAYFQSYLVSEVEERFMSLWKKDLQDSFEKLKTRQQKITGGDILLPEAQL